MSFLERDNQIAYEIIKLHLSFLERDRYSLKIVQDIRVSELVQFGLWAEGAD